MKKTYLRLVFGAVVLLASGLLVGGCEGEDSDEDITATSFRVDRTLTSYDGTDVYDWDTTLSQAQVTVQIKDFRAGDAAIRVYDAAGKLLLSAAFVTPSYTLYVGDNEFARTIGTASGKPGLWKVHLVYNQFTGEQKIAMQ